MKLSVRISMLVVLILMLLASAPNGSVGRSANCRNAASNAEQCPNFRYVIYYTDATKTVECGWLDACSITSEGCQTDYYTMYMYRCCDPARKQ
jgi:hypothetical protein